MERFGYDRPMSADEALWRAFDEPKEPPTRSPRQFIAGGTNLVDYMKLGVSRPKSLVDVNKVAEAGMKHIRFERDTLHLGALVRMSEVEDDQEVGDRCPMLVESLKLAASRQIRNVASLAGNILQRTRCEYFRETSWPCNKRNPGTGCAAIDGFNRQHAVLGTSDACIATYHGDFAQALVALDTTVVIQSPDGERIIPFSELHTRPVDHPERETVLQPDDLIVAIRVGLPDWARRSTYLKVRDRSSYAFALASAAVAVDLDGEHVREARIALGGLATVPWRAVEAEAVLQGEALTEALARKAAEAAFKHATPYKHNAFKIDLGIETIVRALMELKAGRKAA